MKLHIVFAYVVVLGMSAPAVDADTSRNLLPNGDAEMGEVGKAPPKWVGLSYAGGSHDKPVPMVTTDKGRGGGKGIAFDCPSGFAWTYVQQFVPVAPAPDKRAVYRVWLRADRPVSGVGLHLYVTPQGNREGGFNARSEIDVTAEWKQYSIAFDFALMPKRTAAKYNLRPIVQLHTGGATLHVDDASIDLEPSEMGAKLARVLKEAAQVPLGDDVVTINAPVGSYGGIIARPDGSLIAVENQFKMRRSIDGGRTWSASEPMAIDDKHNHITGGIAMSDGSIGVWTESWGSPMYFWRSEDEGKTWSNRYTMGPKGAPLHGNVMVEMLAASVERKANGWSRGTMTKDEKHDVADSKSSLRVVEGGHKTSHAAALRLVEPDVWMYAQSRITPDRALKAGDRFVYRAAVRADRPARFDLYIEAWNGKTNQGSRTRDAFDATTDWKTYEVTLDIGAPAEGLESFRIIVQLYTPEVELRFDDVTVERVAPDTTPMAVSNGDFDRGPVGRLVIPCREGHTVHGGLWQGAGSYGTTHDGRRVHTEGHAHAMEMDIGFVYYSNDGGRSWKRSEGDIIIWKDDGYGGMWPVDEPNVAQLKDGRLVMFMRTTLGRLYQSFSKDGGARWSCPEPTDLPSSYSPCSLERIPRAGDLLCVWNNVSNYEIKRGFRRGRLSAAISKDDGKTWINAKTIDTAGVPSIKGIAPLSAPGMVRGADDLGELPLPFGNVHYPDITIAGDKVLIRYNKSLVNPQMNMGTPMHIIPSDWFYRD